MGLQSVLGLGLQSVAKWITKCIRDYKVYQSGLKSASALAKCSGLQSELVHSVDAI